VKLEAFLVIRRIVRFINIRKNESIHQFVRFSTMETRLEYSFFVVVEDF